MLEKYQLECLRDLGVEWALETSNQIKSDTVSWISDALTHL